VATGVVVIVNVALVEPAGTVTLAGTVAAALPEVRLTDIPPVGAGPVKVTVPVDDVPPMTAVGFKLTPDTIGALTVKLAVFVALSANVPVMTTGVLAETAVVVIAKFAIVPPCATVTEAGTVTAALFELRLTTVPPTPAVTAT
jgi:hypothetical protein